MEGEAKRDYPASIFYQSPWWRQYKYVEDYFSRLGVMLNQGAPVWRRARRQSDRERLESGVRAFVQRASPLRPRSAEMEDKYADLFLGLSASGSTSITATRK